MDKAGRDPERRGLNVRDGMGPSEQTSRGVTTAQSVLLQS